MFDRIPVVAQRIGWKALWESWCSRNESAARAQAAFAQSYGGAGVRFTGSGTAAFYLALTALARNAGADEVILPAYTARTLVYAIRKAGLRPVLCDISLEDFNIDIRQLQSLIGNRTLAVVAVHMFGIPVQGIAALKAALPQRVYLIEDFCQAMGGVLAGKPLGTFGQLSFCSFNRGKNLPLLSGGLLCVQDAALWEPVCRQYQQVGSVLPGTAGLFFKMCALAAVMRPKLYGFAAIGLSALKEQPPSELIRLDQLSGVQAGLALRLLDRMPTDSLQRFDNAAFLLQELKGLPGLQLPQIAAEARPALNRFPVLFRDTGAMEKVRLKLSRCGIESSRMYLRPLHHDIDLGYSREAFPQACYLAEHLLTLPVHAFVGPRIRRAMVAIIKEYV